jgi:hypothetical protein
MLTTFMNIGKEPQPFFDALIKEHWLKLKGVGKTTSHLGGDLFCETVRDVLHGSIILHCQNASQLQMHVVLSTRNILLLK